MSSVGRYSHPQLSQQPSERKNKNKNKNKKEKEKEKTKGDSLCVSRCTLVRKWGGDRSVGCLAVVSVLLCLDNSAQQTNRFLRVRWTTTTAGTQKGGGGTDEEAKRVGTAASR